MFVSNKPEDNNIAVENEVITDKTELENALKRVERESFTLQETLRTKEFWLAGIISMIPPMVSTGLTFHFFKIMELRSIANELAAMIIGLMAFPAFFIPFIAKVVIDKYPLKYTLAVTMIMVILSLLFLIFFVSNQITAIIFVLFYGFATAIQNVSMNVLWPNYFGRNNLGSIRGAATVFMVVGSALGALPFGLSYDLTGSYNTAIIAMMTFAFITFVLSFFIKKPERKLLNNSI